MVKCGRKEKGKRRCIYMRRNLEKVNKVRYKKAKGQTMMK
jgi:hypothetical protein